MMGRLMIGSPMPPRRGTVVVRGQALLVEQFSTANPPLRHVVPGGPTLRIAGELGHQLALGGMFQKFLRWIHRRDSTLEAASASLATYTVPNPLRVPRKQAQGSFASTRFPVKSSARATFSPTRDAHPHAAGTRPSGSRN